MLLFSERALVCALLSVNGKFQEGSPSESLWICFLCSARAGDIYIQNYRSSEKGRAAQPVLTCVFWRPPPLQSCNLHLNCPLIGVLTVFHNRILHLSPLCQTESLHYTTALKKVKGNSTELFQPPQRDVFVRWNKIGPMKTISSHIDTFLTAKLSCH